MESAWSTQTKAGVQKKALIFQAAYNITNATQLFQRNKKKGQFWLQKQKNISFTVF